MKKTLLFSLMAVLLAGFWFGGVSLADECTDSSVAKIGNVCYGSLQSAVTVAQDGDTVSLLKDFTQTGVISNTSKKLTLDFSGHTINTSVQKLFTINGGSLVVKDSSVGGGINSSNGYVFYVTSGSVTINGGNITGKSTLIVDGENATAEVNDGTFVGYQNGNSTSVQAKHGAIVTINSGTFIAGQNPGDDKPQKVIYAGDDGNNCGKADQNYEIKGGTINVNGGYFEGRLSKSNSGTYNIIGGTFKVSQNKTAGVGCDYTVCDTPKSNDDTQYRGDPSSCKSFLGMSAMLNPGYIAEPTGEEGVYTVKAGSTVAVTFSTNGKTANTVVYIRKGDTISKPTPDTKFSREENGTFNWYLGDSETVFDFTNTQITSDITLYGKWQHTVSFDDNGGEGTITNQEIRDGQKVERPDNPTKKGEVFVGWFNGDDAFDFDVALTNTDNLEITLTGQREAMISTGEAKIDDGTENGTGMVVEAEAPATLATAASDVQSSNSTATVQGEVELNVYNDADGNGVKDDGAPISDRVNFTKAVLVRIPVNSGSSVKIKVKHNGVGQTFGIDGLATTGVDCNNGVASSNVYDGSARSVNSGYAEIWTCSASTFVAYTEVTNPTSSTSPSRGGGGGTTYSCERLPANAVANNISKPKKDTNYSYSTDTGAVCTFQCKSGYTWNEKNSKCEKSEETVADTNENTDNADTSDSTSTEDLKKVLDDGYTVEFHNAYDFAFKNGITTMPSIDEAHMNSPLTRIAMAKMLSQYAINVLGKKPANVVVPNFPDVSPELDAEYNNGVTLAYQLGIMGINIENFRPDDLVTRAEFATALSRLLYNTPDGEGAYYETHLKKLMEEKVITVADPDMHELRGYVMIMLMRSAKNN